MSPDSHEIHLENVQSTTFVEQIEHYSSVSSTNDVALKLSKQPLPTPLLVMASEQTAGRGRGQNQWWSATGALTFSLLLDPAKLGLAEDQWPRASLTTGLAVCTALQKLVPHLSAQLKWPNDVFLEGRKVSGILVEVGPRPTPKLVLGIGVNVNNSFESAPSELRSSGISLVDAAGRLFSREQVLTLILQQLEHQLARLRDDDPRLADDWRRCCLLKGQTVEVLVGAEIKAGRCEGIATDGALIVHSEQGEERLYSGVVQNWKSADGA